ncbi:YndJ family protein [Sporosarcina cascadiensis]|uniref:YndJ family protein n=1 Tax=Sporosarcina cascadiensis TaxID=2660747 RepID=UPI00129ADC5A|nr:YndJ family protein [Sporosarcina cascadiensis]
MRNFVLLHVSLFVITVLFSMVLWPYLLLTAAQLLYIPILLKLVCKEQGWFWKVYPYFAIPAYVSVMVEQIASPDWGWLLAAIYLLFTVFVAGYGLYRFLHRGFTNVEEFSIDMGLIYLAMGGSWYFAFIAGIDLGFSPLLTWLTAIHFHYSAFILPIFVGLIGRLYSSRHYRSAAVLLLVAPMAVAVGITFSRWIEVISVLFYFYGLGVMIWITWRLFFLQPLQKWFVRISLTALAVTISFSMLYVLSNGFGLFSTTIDFMLRFHGILNCIVFALVGLIGWMLAVPPSRFQPPTFPVSKIRGRQSADQIGEIGEIRGLSDDLRTYGVIPSANIIDFYENTVNYRLKATVHWHTWFKPFAYCYSFISRRTQQINLPFHNREIEMTGDIFTVHEGLDGREHVRIWERKIGKETVFTALYSQHHSNEKWYMNIALPLPFTTMTGVLELHDAKGALQLTSQRTDGDSDAGVYLSIGKDGLFKLPLQENFLITENGEEGLQAEHTMWIFSLPFLTINYRIEKY